MKVKHKFAGGFLGIFIGAFIVLNYFLNTSFVKYHENKIKEEMNSLYKNSYSIVRLYFQLNNLEGNEKNFTRYIPNISNSISEQNNCQIDIFDENLYKEYSYYLDDYLFDFEDDVIRDVLEAAKENKSALSIWRSENRVTGYLSFPIYVDENFLGNMLISKDYSEEHFELMGLMNSIRIIVSITFLIMLLFSYFLAERIIRPLSYIKKSFESIGKGDYNINLKVYSKDEIGELSEGVNKMADKIEDQIEKINTEKEKVLTLEKTRSEFFNNVTHELKTPLTNISGYAQIMSEEGFNDEDFRSFALERIDKESKRMHELIISLIEVSKNRSSIDEKKRENFNIKSIINEIADDLSIKAKSHGVTINKNLDEVYFNCVDEEIRRIIINILDNAIKYSLDNREVLLQCFKEGENLIINIENYSEEISEEGVEKIFEPFYRENVKKSRALGGNGLGLYICQSLIEKYHGSITFEYKDGKVKVRLIL